MAGPAIQTFALAKRFEPAKGILGKLGHSTLKEPVTAVDGVDLVVEKGELFGLLGPNGAGKTTLVKMLCTLVLPTSGSAMVNGWDVVSCEHMVRQSIGLVGSEERSFYWRLSARQNLEFFSALHGLEGERMNRRICEVLDLMGLSNEADRMFQTFSTGMKQKMCIARGLLTDPAVLFLDEPTRSLDPIVAQSIRTFVKDVLVREQGRTVVLTTHRLEEAAEVCDRIAIMDRGRVKACGTLDELRAVLGAPCRYELVTSRIEGNVRDKLMRANGLDDAEIHQNGSAHAKIRFSSKIGDGALRDVIHTLVSSGVDIMDCRSEEVSLEEIFARVVTER